MAPGTAAVLSCAHAIRCWHELLEGLEELVRWCSLAAVANVSCEGLHQAPEISGTTSLREGAGVLVRNSPSI